MIKLHWKLILLLAHINLQSTFSSSDVWRIAGRIDICSFTVVASEKYKFACTLRDDERHLDFREMATKNIAQSAICISISMTQGKLVFACG